MAPPAPTSERTATKPASTSQLREDEDGMDGGGSGMGGMDGFSDKSPMDMEEILTQVVITHGVQDGIARGTTNFNSSSSPPYHQKPS
jgi:hypothetical protein